MATVYNAGTGSIVRPHDVLPAFAFDKIGASDSLPEIFDRSPTLPRVLIGAILSRQVFDGTIDPASPWLDI